MNTILDKNDKTINEYISTLESKYIKSYSYWLNIYLDIINFDRDVPINPLLDLYAGLIAVSLQFKPNYKKDTEDKGAIMNKEKITWKGTELVLRGKQYIARKMPETKEIYLYDHDSYMRAIEVPGVDPVLVAIIKTNENGEKEIHKV